MKREVISQLVHLIRATLISLIVLCGLVFAVPSTINYQGRLTTSGGTPLQGTFSVQFTIYDHVSGGLAKWQETQSVTTEADGSFAVLLGTVVPIIDTIFVGCSPSLGIKVGADPEMAPRLAFTTVPYACLVSSVDGSSGGTIRSKVTIGWGNTNTGAEAFVAGVGNAATGDYSSIGGGSSNWATSQYATVGGGSADSAGGQYSTVGGGMGNKASNLYSTASGGYQNHADGIFAVVAGGAVNTATDLFAVAGGGYVNTASDSAASVVGGAYNQATGPCSAIGGGSQNVASGFASAIPGGTQDTASGKYSLAAGRLANAKHAGAFVWADSTAVVFPSSAANQFSVRASGGTRVYSNSALTAGVSLAPGASAWSAVSDSSVKRNIRPVDGEEILNSLDQLPVSRWSYKAQDPGIEHIGPMAQDFYTLFRCGESDTTISTIDPSGIALAAIKELHKKLREVDALKAEVQELKAMVRELAADRSAKNGGR
jgi:hypothetical protein